MSNIENDSARTVLFNNKRSYENKVASVEDDYPNYYAYKYDLSTPTILDLRESFSGPNESLIAYFYGDTTLYVALITPLNQHFMKLSAADSLADQVISLRSEIMDQESDFISTSTSIYEQIFRPVEEYLIAENITNLTIINDGVLTMLPFELLNDSNDYLLSKYTIHYANSASLMLREKNKSFNSNSLISFAPVFGGSSDAANRDVIRGELASLPGAIEEANSVVEFFDGKSILEKEATETSFKSNVGDFGVIHLATHAIIDDTNPDNSKLIFYAGDSTNNDGYLHAYEIYNLDLNAQLVTLSACNTGFGEIKKGEGVMSLSRAFAYAGVPATVVSLWPASDKSTPELMKYFYTNLKNGQPKDVALNNARKEFLASATGKARHPFYWGGFILIGDKSPLEEGRNLLVYLLPSVLIIVMILTMYRRKKKGV